MAGPEFTYWDNVNLTLQQYLGVARTMIVDGLDTGQGNIYYPGCLLSRRYTCKLLSFSRCLTA